MNYYQAKIDYMSLPMGASGSKEEDAKDLALANLLDAIAQVYTAPVESTDELKQKLDLFIETELETLEHAQLKGIKAISADLKRLANEDVITISM